MARESRDFSDLGMYSVVYFLLSRYLGRYQGRHIVSNTVRIPYTSGQLVSMDPIC